MKKKPLIADYFRFSRRDRIGVIALAIIVLLVFFLPGYFKDAGPAKPTDNDTAWIAKLRILARENPIGQAADSAEDDAMGSPSFSLKSENYPRREPNANAELFYFDPNTLPVSGWARLGIKERTIQTIIRYRDKGGRFRTASDLQRIYGLHADDYRRLLPYVRLPADNFEKNFKGLDTHKPFDKTRPATYSSRNEFAGSREITDINSADTAAFIRLPGIGSKLATRIVGFRDKLGGFYRIEQVGEVFGLADSVFQKIRPYLKLNAAALRKININTASIEELKAHPYIRYQIANALLAYRKEHGNFNRLEDIKRLALITEDVYNKINPYLTVNPM